MSTPTAVLENLTDNPSVERPVAAQFFLDFETTGLDETQNDIVDIGVIVVDSELNELHEYATAVHASSYALATIAQTPIVLDMMTANGLLEEVIAGSLAGTLPSVAEVEDRLIGLVDEFATPGVKVTLAGSGVATFDYRWIKAQMPRFAKRLNYWTADVGVLRRSWREATGGDLVTVNNDKPHRGLDDVRLHLEEARAHRKVMAKLAEVAGGADYDTVIAFLDRATTAA